MKPAKMPERICYNREEHGPHRWSPDSGLSYLQCPGGEAREDVSRHCGNTQHHPEHPWAENSTRYWCGGDRGYDGIPAVMRCSKRSDHEAHDWRLDHLEPSSALHCPGVPEKDSPLKWKYHVETRTYIQGPDQFRVVKKYGGNPNGQIVAEYTSAVYARIVADALNGGVLLGFEVEK